MRNAQRDSPLPHEVGEGQACAKRKAGGGPEMRPTPLSIVASPQPHRGRILVASWLH